MGSHKSTHALYETWVCIYDIFFNCFIYDFFAICLALASINTTALSETEMRVTFVQQTSTNPDFFKASVKGGTQRCTVEVGSAAVPECTIGGLTGGTAYVVQAQSCTGPNPVEACSTAIEKTGYTQPNRKLSSRNDKKSFQSIA